MKEVKPMAVKYYLLDSNVVIAIWNRYPKLIKEIENVKEIDFKISKDIAGELSKKEYIDFKGVTAFSDRFLRLLEHVLDEDNLKFQEDLVKNGKVKYENNMYFVDGNKISINDYNLINICKGNEMYVLVTEDKRMYESAKVLIGGTKVLTFNQFIEDIYRFI